MHLMLYLCKPERSVERISPRWVINFDSKSLALSGASSSGGILKYLFGCPNGNPILFCFYVLSYNRTVNPENFSSLYRKTKILKF